MDTPTYLPKTEYETRVVTVGRIHNLVPSLKIGVCAWTGTTTDQIKIAIGETFNIWPESIRDDV